MFRKDIKKMVKILENGWINNVQIERMKYLIRRKKSNLKILVLYGIHFLNNGRITLHYFELIQFKQREKHYNVLYTHQEDGQNLGAWLNRQRQDRKNKILDTTKEKRLEDLGVIWDQLSQQWEDNFTLLVQYKQRDGDCNVPYSHNENGRNLGMWLSTQRRNKRKRKLSEERRHRLETIGVIWKLC